MQSADAVYDGFQTRIHVPHVFHNSITCLYLHWALSALRMQDIHPLERTV